MAAAAAAARPSSAQYYANFQRTHADHVLSKRALSNSRRQDMECIKAEAVAVGFAKDGIDCHYYGKDCSNDIQLTCADGKTRLTIHWYTNFETPHWFTWRRSDRLGEEEPQYLQPIEIEILGLTPAQVYFLEWSHEWETKIWPYWEGTTAFTSIDEFIQDLKQNIEHVYSNPPIKSSAKIE